MEMELEMEMNRILQQMINGNARNQDDDVGTVLAQFCLFPNGVSHDLLVLWDSTCFPHSSSGPNFATTLFAHLVVSDFVHIERRPHQVYVLANPETRTTMQTFINQHWPVPTLSHKLFLLHQHACAFYTQQVIHFGLPPPSSETQSPTATATPRLTVGNWLDIHIPNVHTCLSLALQYCEHPHPPPPTPPPPPPPDDSLPPYNPVTLANKFAELCRNNERKEDAREAAIMGITLYQKLVRRQEDPPNHLQPSSLSPPLCPRNIVECLQTLIKILVEQRQMQRCINLTIDTLAISLGSAEEEEEGEGRWLMIHEVMLLVVRICIVFEKTLSSMTDAIAQRLIEIVGAETIRVQLSETDAVDVPLSSPTIDWQLCLSLSSTPLATLEHMQEQLAEYDDDNERARILRTDW